MGELLKFPRNKEHTKPMSSVELSESIEQFRMGYIEDISDFLLTIILSEMGRAGFDFFETDENDILLILESLRSLMMKKSGFEHSLQQIAQQNEEKPAEEIESDEKEIIE